MRETIVFVCMLGLLFGFSGYSQVKELKVEQATLEQVLTEKDKEINELTYQRNVLQNAIDELERKMEEKEAIEVSRVFMCETSAYTSADGLTPSNIMANGEVVHVGAVACNFLPIGTQVRINGNIYTVKDRCGVDNCIDIYMESYSDCINWGRRIVEVEVL